jgi:CheY-like chemotaxis protein
MRGRSNRGRRMEDQWLGAGVPVREWGGAELDVLGRPTILLVEDDNDIRDLLATLLHLAGFGTEPCRTAEEGLERLREQHFDLVLTDYMLPHRSGTWLLRQASDEGLLEGTPAILVTAHPDPRDAEGYEVIRKPFDLDELVDRVKRRLESGNAKESSRQPRSSKKRSNHSGDGHQGDCPDPVELILYVSAESPTSASAIANIKATLSRYKSLSVKLTICDVSKDPSGASTDGGAFPPTLVKHGPGPRTFILGHITNPELLLELLEACEEP